mmetsp:Transcript_43443/g.124266  ORF Transcript_43443/g.124266 Transcript_43443/m.124266 type:complete len:233 (-) Transcript_43443:857-1555(-)
MSAKTWWVPPIRLVDKGLASVTPRKASRLHIARRARNDDCQKRHPTSRCRASFVAPRAMLNNRCSRQSALHHAVLFGGFLQFFALLDSLCLIDELNIDSLFTFVNADGEAVEEPHALVRLCRVGVLHLCLDVVFFQLLVRQLPLPRRALVPPLPRRRLLRAARRFQKLEHPALVIVGALRRGVPSLRDDLRVGQSADELLPVDCPQLLPEALQQRVVVRASLDVLVIAERIL